MSETIVGIDLGTTNSLVALQDERGLRILRDGESTLIPSVIVFDSEGKVQAVGQRAKTLKALDPKNVVYSVKRLMGKGKADLPHLPIQFPFDFSESTDQMIKIKVGRYSYTPLDLSAEILKRCKSVAENELGRTIRKAVVTVPAYFDEGQRSATALAGRLAGLEVVRILNEPTAAALAFGLGGKNGIVAVYDFGGGTFDISILRVTDGIFEVLSTSGDTQLGGDDLDQAIATWLLREKIKAVPQSAEDKMLFLSQVENLKKRLSGDSELEAKFHWDGEIRWQGTVTAGELEKALRPVVQKTIEACRSAVTAAQIPVADIDEIVMVGGSSRVPLVRKMVADYFKKVPNTSVNPEEVVALGAAIQASILAGETKATLLLDVVPLSLGLETMGGVVSKLIPRNSTIPCSASERFTTYVDNQTAVDLHVVQGEREISSECRSLGRFKLRIPPGPAGLSKIKVTFLMDANGMLQVHALDEQTKVIASLEVRPSFGLTDEEVERMLQDAWDHAARDFATRQLIEATNQANSLLLATERSLQSPLLEPEFKVEQEARILPVIKALRQDLQLERSEVIVLRTKELDLVTRELAETIMNRAVQTRLREESIERLSADV